MQKLITGLKLKISQKTQNILEPTVTIEFRLKNKLDFYNFFKIDLIKIAQVAFSENFDYNSEACIYIQKKQMCDCVPGLLKD